MSRKKPDVSGTSSVTAAQIEEAAAAARMCGGGHFTVSDVLTRLGAKATDEDMINRVLRTLDADESLFCADEDHICGRAEFFTGKNFLITPDEFELQQGILIPGHRTAGWVSSAIFPSEAVLFDEETGKPFPLQDFTARVDMIYNYFLLLGSEQLFDFLAADNPANMALQQSPSPAGKAVITVFDMRDFYERNGFRAGDALLCTVRDYASGEIAVRHLPAEKRDTEAGRAWTDAMADVLEEVIGRFEHYFDIPEQLAWGFLFGGEKLFLRPEAMRSVDEFIRETDRIEIRYQEDHTVLACCADDAFDPEMEEAEADEDEDHDECGCGGHHHDRLPEEVRISRGETEDFAKILRELGLLLTPVEIDSYILDSASFRAPDYDEFFRRCFGGRKLEFADDAQEAVFHNMVEDRWETYTANYDRENDSEKAELRGQILELLDTKIEFLNSVEHPETLPAPEMRKLAEISIYLDELLRLLNSPRHELEAGEADNMSEKIADLGETQDALIAKMQS